MALVDDHKVVVAPVEAFKVEPVRFAMVAREVGVEEDVVPQAVLRERIVDVVALVGVPVRGQFLRTQHQHRLVAAFVVLHDRQRRQRLAEAHAVRKDAAVELLELADDRQHGVALEAVEHLPDLALAESRRLVRQFVLRDVLKELVEDVVEREEVDDFGRVLAVGGGKARDHGLGDVLEARFVRPQLVEEPQVVARVLAAVRLLDGIVDVVAALAAEIDRGEPVERHVGRVVHVHEPHHPLVRHVRPERRLAPQPVGALLRNRPLGQLVAQPDLELRAADAALAGKARNVELAGLLRRLLRHEGRRREDEAQLVDARKLPAQFPVGVDREAGRRDGKPASLADVVRQVFPDGLVHIVDDLHARRPMAFSSVPRP